MRILILAAVYPDTLADGFKLLLYQLISGYHRLGHKVDLMAFLSASDSPAGGLDHVRVESFCENVVTFDKVAVPPWRSPRRWPTIINPLDSSSLGDSSVAFVEELRTMLERHPPDIVQFEGFTMLQYRKYVAKAPCVAFPHDCMTLTLEREKAQTLSHKVRLAVRRRKVRRLEGLYSSFEFCLFVARPDAERARQLAPDARVVWAPNGVNADYFAPFGGNAEPETVAFHGSMGFPPNVEAAMWFATQVWPRLKDRHPAARFLVVGSRPSAQLLAAARSDPRIVVTGSIPDIRPHLDRTSVVVVPMQSGAGIKNKVLEGMAMAKPVVANGLSMAGIEHAVAGEHFVLAESAEEFTAAISMLWEQPDCAARIGAGARELVRTHYSWESLQGYCERLLHEVHEGACVG